MMICLKMESLLVKIILLNNRRKVLDGKGKISRETAMQKAENEYKVFRVKQDREYVSEFDREVEKYLKG